MNQTILNSLKATDFNGLKCPDCLPPAPIHSRYLILKARSPDRKHFRSDVIASCDGTYRCYVVPCWIASERLYMCYISEHLPPSSLLKCSFEIMDIKDEIPRPPQCYGITILCPWSRDDDESATEMDSGGSAIVLGRIPAVTVIYYFSRVYSGSAPCTFRVFFTSILGIGAK